MLFLTGNELKSYIEEKTDPIWEKRDFVSKLEEYLCESYRKGILLTGLSRTGKTVGILQAVRDCLDLERTVYFAPVSKEEGITGEEACHLLKAGDFECVIVEEYPWIERECGVFSDYLAGLSQMEKKVIITGTENSRVLSLRVMDFIHRSFTIDTNFLSYTEYLRVQKGKESPDSLRRYLVSGGIFENGNIKDYLQRAVVDDLVAYKPQKSPEFIKTAVYTSLYDCIRSLCGEKISYADFLRAFDADPDIPIPSLWQKEITAQMRVIGILTRLEDVVYLTNQTVAARIIEFYLGKMPEEILGRLYEVSKKIEKIDRPLR
jgi:hypothetical protein